MTTPSVVLQWMTFAKRPVSFCIVCDEAVFSLIDVWIVLSSSHLDLGMISDAAGVFTGKDSRLCALEAPESFVSKNIKGCSKC